MRSSGCRPYIYIYIYIFYRDSASVESTRGGSLTLAPIRHIGGLAPARPITVYSIPIFFYIVHSMDMVTRYVYLPYNIVEYFTVCTVTPGNDVERCYNHVIDASFPEGRSDLLWWWGEHFQTHFKGTHIFWNSDLSLTETYPNHCSNDIIWI